MTEGITIQLIFQETEADGEICTSCGKEIKGIKFVPMVQVGGPMNAVPVNCSWCILCKNKWDALE